MSFIDDVQKALKEMKPKEDDALVEFVYKVLMHEYRSKDSTNKRYSDKYKKLLDNAIKKVASRRGFDEDI